ncbi:MAG: cytochrome C, partial [Bacteroidales bacterium]|jgi:hypothetical protein
MRRFLSTFATTFLVVMFGFQVQSQISPGDLSQVHAHLEGLSNCTLCHTLGEKVSDEKCMECHTEIKARVEQNEGYHASADVVGTSCVKCHNDHHGVKFEIVRFDTFTFNHDLTGYKLLGKHKTQNCSGCHKKEFISDKKIKDKSYSYLGLNTACLTCHDDFHQKTLSDKCSNCHDFEKFRPAPKFDHNKARFVLKGKHQDVACVKCHKLDTVNGVKRQQFTGMKFDNCTSCHVDVHKNKFGQQCIKCHTETSFTVVVGMDKFNHDKTRFPLKGKHKIVQCNECHKTKITDPIKHDRCLDCHKDYHDKQFVKNKVSPDCKECHTVDSFKDAVFTIEQHNKSEFQLQGAHMATPCFACHLKDNKWTFRKIGKVCNDCHEDIHKDYIDIKYYPGKDCRACHSVESWNQIKFDHQATKFELSGAHERQTCRICHFKGSTDEARKQEFKGLSTKCSQCHQDQHAGQFEQDGLTDCNKCHNNEKWKPAPKFDHNATRFALDERHLNVACIKCHKVQIINNTKVIQYKLNEFKCETCHH